MAGGMFRFSPSSSKRVLGSIFMLGGRAEVDCVVYLRIAYNMQCGCNFATSRSYIFSLFLLGRLRYDEE